MYSSDRASLKLFGSTELPLLVAAQSHVLTHPLLRVQTSSEASDLSSQLAHHFTSPSRLTRPTHFIPLPQQLFNLLISTLGEYEDLQAARATDLVPSLTSSLNSDISPNNDLKDLMRTTISRSSIEMRREILQFRRLLTYLMLSQWCQWTILPGLADLTHSMSHESTILQASAALQFDTNSTTGTPSMQGLIENNANIVDWVIQSTPRPVQGDPTSIACAVLQSHICPLLMVRTCPLTPKAPSFAVTLVHIPPSLLASFLVASTCTSYMIRTPTSTAPIPDVQQATSWIFDFSNVLLQELDGDYELQSDDSLMMSDWNCTSPKTPSVLLLSTLQAIQAISNYQPLFFDDTNSINQYLHSIVNSSGSLLTHCFKFLDQFSHQYSQFSRLPPQNLPQNLSQNSPNQDLNINNGIETHLYQPIHISPICYIVGLDSTSFSEEEYFHLLLATSTLMSQKLISINIVAPNSHINPICFNRFFSALRRLSNQKSLVKHLRIEVQRTVNQSNPDLDQIFSLLNPPLVLFSNEGSVHTGPIPVRVNCRLED